MVFNILLNFGNCISNNNMLLKVRVSSMPSYKQFSLPLPNSEYRWVGVVLCIFVMMLDRVTLAIDIVQFRIQVFCYLGDKVAQFRIQVPWWQTIFLMVIYVLKVSGPIRSESIFYLKNSSRSLVLLLHMCSGMFHMCSGICNTQIK